MSPTTLSSPLASPAATARSGLKTAIVGIGGFAAAHHQVFAKHDQLGDTTVVATCDPRFAKLASVSETWNFQSRSVQQYGSFDEMMARHGADLDLAVIASPIQTHAWMHDYCVRHQIPCYLEKPPTLDPRVLEEMISLEREARVQTHVGFDHIHIAERTALKQRMLSGEFGALKGVSFLGLSQRNSNYFTRNNWAGCLMIGDQILLDSCCGNAMSHHIHNILFFAGQKGMFDWARPRTMNAELYRVNPIQGTDSIFAMGTLDNGVPFRIAASHACVNTASIFLEKMEFAEATVEIHSDRKAVIIFSDGSMEEQALPGPSLAGNIQSYLDYRQHRTARPNILLEDCRGVVECNALFYLAAGRIHEVSPAFVHAVPGKDGVSQALALYDVEKAADLVIWHGILPSQTEVPWGRPGGTASIQQLPSLPTAVQNLANEACRGPAAHAF